MKVRFRNGCHVSIMMKNKKRRIIGRVQIFECETWFNNTPERISETSLEKYQCSAWMRWGSISTIKQKNFKKASNTQNLIYDHISIYYQNCREFNSNTHSIYKYVLKSDHRISAITEIWLRDGESNSKLFPENYLVYRGDRSYGVRGAGVLLAVNDDFCTSRWC